VREIAEALAELCTEDETVSAGPSHFLAHMMEHTDPNPYDWDYVEVQLETYPSLDLYLEVDRTAMLATRPTGGSVTIQATRPDPKQAHFGIVGFYDQKEGQHNPKSLYPSVKRGIESRNGSIKIIMNSYNRRP